MKEYSLAIASNFLDHYMLALSNELKKCFKDFYFVASEKLEEDYKKLGFDDLNELDFVVKAYEDNEKAKEIILSSDVVITGSYAFQSHIKQRIKMNKPVLFYSERLFKNSNPIGYILRYIKYYLRHRNDNKSILLCVSAYAAKDYNRIGLFNNRTYKWGYFPEIKKYNVDELINSKKKNSLIWVGRLVKWKHPEYALEVARMLKDENFNFSLEIIGTGNMKQYIERKVEEYNLKEYVILYNNGMSPDSVRKHMENSEIFLFTSNKSEGWGVVLNEAMNSACACIASNSAGSTPFLINDDNGLKYYNDSLDELLDKTKYLLNNEKIKRAFSKAAYRTIVEDWNPSVSAKRIYEYVRTTKGKEGQVLFESGILSKA